jgi:hypothetical protein
VSRYICFTNLKHLIFWNGGSICNGGSTSEIRKMLSFWLWYAIKEYEIDSLMSASVRNLLLPHANVWARNNIHELMSIVQTKAAKDQVRERISRSNRCRKRERSKVGLQNHFYMLMQWPFSPFSSGPTLSLYSHWNDDSGHQPLACRPLTIRTWIKASSL